MLLNFIVVLIAMICILGQVEVICRSFTKEEGPYNLIVHNTSNCVREQPWFHTNISTFTNKGKSLLRGTIAIQREMKNVRFRIQLNYYDQGTIKVFEMKNQSCQNMIIQLVLKALGLKYNDQKCTMKPTTAEFDKLNLDSIFHAVTNSIWYGSGLVRWEISVSDARVMCLDINVQIVKA